METKKIFNLADSIAVAEESIVSREFVKNANGGMTLFSFDKGQRLSEHTAPFDAVIQVVEGQALITIDGEPFKVNAGEMIIMPANHPHSVTAEQPFKMLLTMIKG